MDKAVVSTRSSADVKSPLSSLSEAEITILPSAAYYIPNFISHAEASVILNKIATAPKPRWKQLSRRRVQVWPSNLTKDNILLDAPLPDWLVDPVIGRLLSTPISNDDPNNHIFSHSPHKSPNHVLINEYLPGQGIMPHKDGSAYHPVVCTISLCSSLCVDIYGTTPEGVTHQKPSWRILQEPRSLLVTSQELYTDYLHGIAEVHQDTDLNSTSIANWDLLGSPEEVSLSLERNIRISLTYRDVVKVCKLGSKISLSGKT